MITVSPPLIRIAAAVLIDPDGRTLLVRKRGTQAFMQPGGKIDEGESARMALVRELHEELGLQVHAEAPVYLGRFQAAAANEPGCQVQAELFRVDTAERPQAAAEIEALAWVRADETPDLVLAPLTREVILPLYRGLLSAPH
ncbi:MAG: MutT/nudix family hydrolase [Pseudomonas sp.]|uniref:NUDIX hydrolase n=1 Tax=Pseudomonas entomophila TaxID=312306 RepID=UPI0015E2EDEF|nr:NUDIX domain-containing protein [Pseudomonas entomophila]MBA1192050.1 NUDIX domain-containing protein [Pseudomonas entomophila]MDF2488128.1 MutT/nudix family hydrolase [Pseudomonas sp.]